MKTAPSSLPPSLTEQANALTDGKKVARPGFGFCLKSCDPTWPMFSCSLNGEITTWHTTASEALGKLYRATEPVNSEPVDKFTANEGKEVTLQFSPIAHKVQKRIGRFVCDRYYGVFIDPVFQSRADLGNWYARAMGTGLGIVGEGLTPEAAIADMKARAKAQGEELLRVYFGA